MEFILETLALCQNIQMTSEGMRRESLYYGAKDKLADMGHQSIQIRRKPETN